MTAQRSPIVSVTGLGIVSPLGVGIEAFWTALVEGRCAARASPVSVRGIPVPRQAATIGEFAGAVEELVQPKYLRRLSNVSRWSVAGAVGAAHGHGGNGPGDTGGDATAVVLGTSFGASSYHFEYYEKLLRNGLRDASPLLFSESVMNAASGHVAIYLKLRGASLALVGGEEVGLMAILDAFDRVRVGEADAALAGGVDEYCDFVHAAVAARGLVSNERGEPYSGSDLGTFLSEGAAFVRLEALEASARALAVVAAAGASRSLDGPAGAASAVEKAVREAIDAAGAAPESLGLLVTSACGCQIDWPEAEGVARALRLDRRGGEGLPVFTPKGQLGEGFAFTSAAQAVVAVKALACGMAPPSPKSNASRRLPAGLRLSTEPEPIHGTRALAVSTSRRGNAVAVLFERSPTQ